MMRDSTYRGVLWEQVKGLMRAIAASYENDMDNFEAWDEHCEYFIKETEDNGIGGFT